MPADFLGRAEAQQVVRNASAQTELSAQHVVNSEDVALVDVVHDAPVGQLGKRVEVMVPVALGVEEGLMSVGPQLLHDRLQRRPEDVVEMLEGNERHATAMHPEPDRHVLVRIGSGEREVREVRHEGFAGGQHLLRTFAQVVDQSQVAAQLVGDEVQRRAEHPGDRGDRAALGTQPRLLHAPRGEELHHGHRALHQREIVLERDRFADGAQRPGDSGKPDVVEIAGGVLDQRVVFIRLHPGFFGRRLTVLMADVGR